MEEVALSTELRKNFHEQKITFTAFKKEYLTEIKNNPAALEFKKKINKRLIQQNITLLYRAKDEIHNQAAILKEWLNESHY